LPPALEKPLSVDKPALPVGISALSSLPLGSGTPLTARGEGGLSMSKPFGATLAGGGPSVFSFSAALPSSVVGGMVSPVFQGFALSAVNRTPSPIASAIEKLQDSEMDDFVQLESNDWGVAKPIDDESSSPAVSSVAQASQLEPLTRTRADGDDPEPFGPKTDSTPLCILEDGKPSSVICDDCGGALCQECDVQFHKIPKNKSHNRIPATPAKFAAAASATVIAGATSATVLTSAAQTASQPTVDIAFQQAMSVLDSGVLAAEKASTDVINTTVVVASATQKPTTPLPVPPPTPVPDKPGHPDIDDGENERVLAALPPSMSDWTSEHVRTWLVMNRIEAENAIKYGWDGLVLLDVLNEPDEIHDSGSFPNDGQRVLQAYQQFCAPKPAPAAAPLPEQWTNGMVVDWLRSVQLDDCVLYVQQYHLDGEGMLELVDDEEAFGSPQIHALFCQAVAKLKAGAAASVSTSCWSMQQWHDFFIAQPFPLSKDDALMVTSSCANLTDVSVADLGQGPLKRWQDLF